MREEIIVAGSGGQGIMLAGNIIARSALSSGKYTTFYPSYGAEMRGGTANCSVIVSDKEIGSPVISSPSVLLVMNEQSLIKYLPRVRKNGLVIVNSSLVKSYPDASVQIPATGIAIELGDLRAANMVMLGRLIFGTNIFSKEIVTEVIKDVFKGKQEFVAELNIKAFLKGNNYDKKS